MKKKIKVIIKIALFIAFFGVVGHVFAADSLTANAIVKKSDQQMRGDSSYTELTMNIIRPDGTRSMSMKSWTKEQNLSLVLITGPAKERGSASLKRDKEMWGWIPNIERVIKIAPSMLGQSWMGSDFTNDDLINQSSIVVDYDHKIIKEDVIDGDKTWVIDAIAKPDAPVVWSKVRLWISKKTFLQRKVESYDEFDELVHTMTTYDVQNLSGRMVATRMEMVPADKPGNKTEVITHKAHFNFLINDEFFSQAQMKSLRN
ncbi:outer membrane lipoprotein-sorting protein [Aliivibrio sifiae]|uniref:Outer membrane lipoprotein-sorting protein n=1 Tax=Aliivibrio sifiae TaxID=566293 RepID=A0A2S7XCH1_9GAMM|nr:outer membrane lipoprotein-sorting protein [Aliivibrio sifiae]PQJ88967.1 outer membrane lipoprotein-sorting protein [Aliivibrio sifiae]